MEDEKIIELFYARSEDALLELDKKYGVLCKKISSNILKNALDAEECVNEAYLGAWNTIPPQRPNPFLAYICRIVRNVSIKRYHRNTAKKRNTFYDVALEEIEECFPISPTAEDAITAKELTEKINEFLGLLDKTNRVLFMRRYWFADSIEEIAALFKMSKHTVSVRLSRIREKLKKYLKKEGY